MIKFMNEIFITAGAMLVSFSAITAFTQHDFLETALISVIIGTVVGFFYVLKEEETEDGFQ